MLVRSRSFKARWVHGREAVSVFSYPNLERVRRITSCCVETMRCPSCEWTCWAFGPLLAQGVCTIDESCFQLFEIGLCVTCARGEAQLLPFLEMLRKARDLLIVVIPDGSTRQHRFLRMRLRTCAVVSCNMCLDLILGF